MIKSKFGKSDFLLSILLNVSLCAVFFIAVGNVGYKFLKKYTNLVEKTVVYNAEKDFPFENVNAIKNTERDLFLKSFEEKYNRIKLKITNYVTLRNPLYQNCIVFKKNIDAFLGLDMTNSLGLAGNSGKESVVVPFDGEWLGLTYSGGEPESQIRLVLDFAEKMKAEGRNFFVFENPEKFKDYYGFQNNIAEIRKSVNESFSKNGIAFFDVVEFMKENSIDYKDIFFKTDHHWKASSGLWANKILCNYLNVNFGYNIDTAIFDLENYDIRVLKNQFLGSLGKKVTEVYTKSENFEIITPKYDSDLTVFNSAYAETIRGTIAETLYAPKFLEEKNIYKRNDYCFYSYGDQPLITSHNNKLHDGSSLFIIKLSFADAQIPTLTQAVEDFYAVDLRHFTGSLMTLIHQKNPQTVVLAYPANAFTTKNAGEAKHYLFNFK